MPKLLPNTAENFLKNTNLIRLNMLKMIFNGKTGTGHIGSSLSIAEIIFYLFKNIIYKDKKKNITSFYLKVTLYLYFTLCITV